MRSSRFIAVVASAMLALSTVTARGEGATVPLRNLARYPLIMPTRPHAIRMLVEARLAALGAKANVTLEIDAIGAILELVAERFGYAVLSRRALPPGEPSA